MERAIEIFLSSQSPKSSAFAFKIYTKDAHNKFSIILKKDCLQSGSLTS